MELSYNKSDVLSRNKCNKKRDFNASDTLLIDFDRLRISALTRAAEISPYVKEVTIGPHSPNTEEINKTSSSIQNNLQKVSTDVNLNKDKLREDLRYTLLIKENEMKQRETSEELFKNLVEKMVLKRADILRKFFDKQSEECERKAIELKMRKLKMLKELKDNDNISVLQRAKLEEQQCQLINKQTMENMNKLLEEQTKATARFASVSECQTKICVCYNDIVNLIQSEPHGKEIGNKYTTSVNCIMINISAIVDTFKTGAITDKEVKQAEVLAANIDNIKSKIITDLNNLKHQEQMKKQEELRIKELEQQKSEQAKALEVIEIEKTVTDGSAKSAPRFYSAHNYSSYEELQNYLNDYENKYKDLLENTNLKKFRFDCQKAVNTPVNAISSVSGIHMKDKFNKLSKLLRGEKVQVLDIYVTATSHPQGLYYCTALLAKKIVRQGDLLVSSNPESAFPLAAIAAALCAQFPEFGKLLQANFHKYCPYLVPMFLPHREGQTDKEFYISRGYTYTDDIVEKQDKFLKRMSGIFRLQCAIWISKTPRFVNSPNPYSLRCGWQWLASFLNLRPEPDICATLLHDFFTICGSEFFSQYRKQFSKIIKLVCTDYLAILVNIDEGGPKTRLEVFLQNVLKTNHIPPPSGLLPSNTW